MFQDQDVEALTGVGLTTLQARIYLTTASLEKATIKTISKTANTARQEIYRAVAELQEKGLIEKVIVHQQNTEPFQCKMQLTFCLNAYIKKTSGRMRKL
jgi:hypothetical protein